MKEVIYLPCAIEHIALIKPREGEVMDKAYFMQDGFRYMVDDNFAISAWVDHKCIGAAGILPIYPHRATAWALIGEEAGPYMRQLTRKVRAALDISPYKRIEMLVNYDFKPGHKWAKMLGFKVDAPRMEASGVYGHDETLYARIKT